MLWNTERRICQVPLCEIPNTGITHGFIIQVAMAEVDEEPSCQIMLHIFWTDAETDAYRYKTY